MPLLLMETPPCGTQPSEDCGSFVGCMMCTYLEAASGARRALEGEAGVRVVLKR